VLTQLRTPAAIRWQLINGKAVRSLSDFRNHLDSIKWGAFPKNAHAILRVTTRKSKLNRSDILRDKAERFFKVVLGVPSEEGAPLHIHIRIFENKLWVSVSLHDRPLHQRGWRTANVKTPIRENWAQCMLWLAECTSDETIVDPFCGSGTILVEAGRRFGNCPTFVTSPWVFNDWDMDWTVAKWDTTPEKSTHVGGLFGSDRDGFSVEKTRRNAEKSGVQVEIVESNIRSLTPNMFTNLPETGVIVCNPPYGMGSGRKTDAVYHWLGEVYRTHFSTWRLYFIATDSHKAKLVSKEAKSIAQFSNAGIPVTLYRV
jgi:23S rRNA G2445 N2-methylase RlmL